jgi:hypothetical protein
MRKTPAGHVHGPGCGHYKQNGRWQIFASEPVVRTEDFPEYKRKNPSFGVYDFEGKTYWIRHEHGDQCRGIHQLKGDRWIYVEE